MLRNGGTELDVSFLLLNNDKQVINFFLSQPEAERHLFVKTPQIGLLFEDFISPQRNIYFSYLIKKSIEDHSILVDSISNNNANTLIIVVPIAIYDDLIFTVFMAVSNIACNYEVSYKNNYPRFTSHILRSPISNLLALSDPNNHSMHDLYTDSKINELLKTIYSQAIKLNDIVATLNTINSFNEEEVEQYPVIASRSIKDIMLVDDDAIANRLHQHLLKKLLQNTNVLAFDHPEEALAYLLHKHADVILLDINMPQINGWMFLDELSIRHIKTEVVMVTSSKDPKERQRAMTYEFVKGFVSKPLSSEKIKTIFNIPSL